MSGLANFPSRMNFISSTDLVNAAKKLLPIELFLYFCPVFPR